MSCRRPRQRNDRSAATGSVGFIDVAALAPCCLLMHVGLLDRRSPHHNLRALVNVGVSVQASSVAASALPTCRAVRRPISRFRNWSESEVLYSRRRWLTSFVHLEYDQPGQDDTLVAGHPVDLSASFDDSGRVVRIEIKTLDHTSLYMRKKAYRLGLQAREHYGDGGWTCKSAQPKLQRGSDRSDLHQRHVLEDGEDNRAIEVTSRFFHKTGGSPM